MARDLAASGTQSLQDALLHMETALALLDDADAPPQIGARLDFAICELRALITPPLRGGGMAERPPPEPGV